MWDQDEYTRAWRFACHWHQGQTVPGGDLPYVNHVANVAMEVMAAVCREDFSDPTLAVQCALLHDTIEDTPVTFEDVSSSFGPGVAAGVMALSKNPALPDKRQRMLDSLERIKAQPREVWVVKLSDRIVNLQPPPSHWGGEKIRAYGDEAGLILEELGSASPFLASRLAAKIENYATYA